MPALAKSARATQTDAHFEPAASLEVDGRELSTARAFVLAHLRKLLGRREAVSAHPYDGAVAEILLRIGDLAERAGVSADSVRHYERLGLVPAAARTDGGYRLFPTAAVERVQLIRSAVRVGFSLRQLAGFLGERRAGGVPCRRVRDAAERLLAGVDAQITELMATKTALTAIVHDWDERLARTPPNQPARLLDAMGPAAIRPIRTSHPGVARSDR